MSATFVEFDTIDGLKEIPDCKGYSNSEEYVNPEEVYLKNELPKGCVRVRKKIRIKKYNYGFKSILYSLLGKNRVDHYFYANEHDDLEDGISFKDFKEHINFGSYNKYFKVIFDDGKFSRTFSNKLFLEFYAKRKIIGFVTVNDYKEDEVIIFEKPMKVKKLFIKEEDV